MTRMYKDWRNTLIEEGCTVLHATCERGGAYITESEVIRIIPQRWMEESGLPFPFYLLVKPLRRTDDETRWTKRTTRQIRIHKTEKVTVMQPRPLNAKDIVDWRNDEG